MTRHVISDSPASLARAAADALALVVENAPGRYATIALTGGGTPRGLYALLASEYRERIDWSRVQLFLGDERYVPVDSKESNYRMIRETLLSGAPVPSGNIHPIPTYLPDPASAARLYEATLRDYHEGEWPAFDLVLLGIGADGHVASLFPGNPALEVTDRWVTVVENAPASTPTRISLTLPAINAARNVFFLVSGKEKQEIVSAVMSGGDYPAARVAPAGELVWFRDEG
jgi:6-phosphogluconolactonase